MVKTTDHSEPQIVLGLPLWSQRMGTPWPPARVTNCAVLSRPLLGGAMGDPAWRTPCRSDGGWISHGDPSWIQLELMVVGF